MSHDEILLSIGLIFGLGMAAQWLAMRIQVPSILLLLLSGFLVGAVTGMLNPDDIFGELLFPLVSISVAIILYEGGLGLNFREIRGVGRAFFLVITLGAFITWVLATAGAHYILDLNWRISVLLGAILIVSGPTVVTPLLNHVRPVGRVGPFLKWEGIFIDPVGAIIAVITLQTIVASDQPGEDLFLGLPGEIAITFLVGSVIGIAAAILLTLALRHYLVPDMFEAALSLATVVGVFAVSNNLREESGLLAVTLMGLALANQPFAPIQRIVHFKENLFSLILGSLFVVLGARLEFEHLRQMIGLDSLLFLLFLIFLVRPLAALLTTLRSSFNWKERAFIAWMMPRGIVAAAIASIFELDLAERGIAQADQLVPYTFLVIIGTVVVYGFTALPVARWLGLAGTDPQGVLILGAHPFAQEMGLTLLEEGYRVLLVDTNRTNIHGARLAGLPTYYGNILSDRAVEEMDLTGIGKFVAVTANDEVNSLASVRMADVFGRGNVYQLAPRRLRGSSKQSGTPAQHLRGRIICSEQLTFDYLRERLRNGASLKKTVLTENYPYKAFKEHYGEDAITLFYIDGERRLRIVTPEQTFDPRPGYRLISIVDEVETQARGALQVSPDRVLTAEEMEQAGLLSSYCDWQASVHRHGGTREGPGRREPAKTGK